MIDPNIPAWEWTHEQRAEAWAPELIREVEAYLRCKNCDCAECEERRRRDRR